MFSFMFVVRQVLAGLGAPRRQGAAVSLHPVQLARARGAASPSGDGARGAGGALARQLAGCGVYVLCRAQPSFAGEDVSDLQELADVLESMSQYGDVLDGETLQEAAQALRNCATALKAERAACAAIAREFPELAAQDRHSDGQRHYNICEGIAEAIEGGKQP
jgi:hypothetical protein